ncbi:MAG: DUF885 domain-containing protein [candidate division Zixibacteria bacterium]|nr:DUF885 domain-containing protein [candidate division Zixibacteria bacterium]
MQNSITRQIAGLGQAQDNSKVRLHQLFDLSWKWQMEQFPEWATFLGYAEHNDRWTDRSHEANHRRTSDLKIQLRALESISRGELAAQDQLSYDLFRRGTEEEITAAEFRSELVATTQMDGIHQEIPRVLEVMPVATATQREQFLARLERIPQALWQASELMAEGVKLGITQAQGPLRGLPEQIANQITKDPRHAPMLVALRRRPSKVEPQVWEQFTQQAYSVYTGAIEPALKEFFGFVVDRYLPQCRTEISWTSLPRGKEWYDFLIRKNTTANLSPDQIFETGSAEVARIRGEMERVIASSGFKGSFDEFIHYLRTDKQFYFNKPAELLTAYRDISKRVDPELVRFFGILPRLPYGVTPIPSYMEKQQTTAYYMPGSPKAGRPGYFYANTYDLASRPKWEMEALTLHEAVPGHHLQIAIAQELEDIPEFRKQSWITAYGEGWALYSESLGEQMGFYADPYAKFGQLTFDMWRAIRLVVDPGMHAKGWSRDQAIAYFLQNSSKPKHDIEVEVDRYIVWPGQAVSYKIGELHIRNLRRKAEQELGERFDLRSFHDELLKHGCVPLTTLTEIIESWKKSIH